MLSAYAPETTVDIAFDSGPATDPASYTWTDVSDYVELDENISITGGRPDERGVCEANTCQLVLDNTDGRFTPELASSPYSPNVKMRRPIRVRATYPPTLAQNLLSAANASFESGVGSWTAGGTVPPTLAQSATRAWVGSNSLRITWGTGGSFPLAQVALAGLTIGVVYTFAVYVWVPTGAPDVRTAIGGIAAGTSTAVKDTWVRLTQTFTATGTSHNLQVWPSTSPTAGQQVWVDAAMAVVGSDVGEFNTLTPTTSTRFKGFIDEWLPQWPQSVDDYATVHVSATSRIGMMGGDTAALRSLTQSVVLADSPAAYWPMNEAAGAAAALPLAGTARLVPASGSVTFGDENGPLTDGSSAVKFSHGGGRMQADEALSLPTPFTVEGTFTNVSGDGTYTVLTLDSTSSGVLLTLELAVTSGSPVLMTGTLYPPSGAPGIAQDTPAVVLDNQPHHWCVTIDGATVKVYWDGVFVASDTAGSSWPAAESFALTVGKMSTTAGDAAAVSNVAVYLAELTDPTIADHADAMLTGFTADTADERLARYAAYAGIPAAETDFPAAAAIINHIDIAGVNAIDPMRKVETTDGGVLFDSRAGVLTYQPLTDRYAATSAVALSFLSHELGDRVTPKYGLTGVVNDAAASYSGGSVRIFDQTSIGDNGPRATTLELATDDVDVATDAAAWAVNVYKDPRTRVPNLDVVDLTALDSSKVAALLTLDVGSLWTSEDWPTQAPWTDLPVFVEGYAETINLEQHVLVFNTSPAAIWTDVIVLDDATKGELDSTYKLAR